MQAQNRWLANQNRLLYKSLADITWSMRRADGDAADICIKRMDEHRAQLFREAQIMKKDIKALKAEFSRRETDS